VVASSTGGTQAGLAYARAVIGTGPRIVGVGVAKRPIDVAAEVDRLVHEVIELLQLRLASAPSPVVLDADLGPGYARPSRGATDAAAELLRTEALFTGPVYSAKALHAVVNLAREDPPGGPLVFWHTGGTPALFARSVGVSRWPVAS
jgi:1-aminocyclopropane-1-carboxylate deaminase/D-cysteine desulfhydrase-like pyridoxal-dependent ACC family enzyme